MLRIYRYFYFYNRKSNSVSWFSVKQLNIRENRVKIIIWNNFRTKVMKKWHARKIYQLKLEFYNTDGKMKNLISCIFISIIIHPNFMHSKLNTHIQKRKTFINLKILQHKTTLWVNLNRICEIVEPLSLVNQIINKTI